MPIISRQTIEAIKERVSLYDVASAYVTLKRVGAQWAGLSPFGHEKTPSFYILPEKNIFKCFSSGYAGDVIRFIELKEGLNFQEAVELLAPRFGISIQYEKSSEGGEAPLEKQSLQRELLDIHAKAQEFFERCFWAKKYAWQEQTRHYWEQTRGFSLEAAKEFGIGLAPAQAHGLGIYLEKELSGYSLEAFKTCGLFYNDDRARSVKQLKARFCGRLMIPIRDIQGRVIAFSGRLLPHLTIPGDLTAQSKYINSPETKLFKKGKVLFGLDKARKALADTGHFLLLEGPLDVIRLQINGFRTAVAAQGTGITEEQLSLLQRYNGALYCIMDGDAAGIKAALRLLPMAFKLGLDIHFVPLAMGVDPDTALREIPGVEAFKKQLKDALPPISFAVRLSLNEQTGQGGNSTTAGKLVIAQKIFEWIAQSASSLAQESYLNELAAELGISRIAITEDFEHYLQKKFPIQSAAPSELEKSAKNKNEKLTTVEYQLLSLLFHHPFLVKPVSNLVELAWLNTTTLEGNLLKKIMLECQEDLWEGDASAHGLLSTEAEKNLYYSLSLDAVADKDHVAAAANVCIKALFQRFLKLKQQELDKHIHQCKDVHERRQLQEQRLHLRRLQKTPPQIIAQS